MPACRDDNRWFGDLWGGGGYILIADGQSLGTAMEDQIADETTRAILDEETLVLRPWGSGHLEDDILERGGLPGRPVNSSNQGRRVGIGDIDNEVVDLAPENVGGSPAFYATCLVLSSSSASGQKRVEVGK